MVATIDWCCFYYFVRNSPVALLEALCARIFSFRSVNIGFFLTFFFLLCVQGLLTKPSQPGSCRVVPATASFYFARGNGSHASAGAAVARDEVLRRAGKTCCRHRASGFQASKSVGFRWGIPPDVHVCYKLFSNWNGVVPFVSQDKGCVIWHFHHYCLI